MYVGQSISMKADIAAEKAEFAYPGTVLIVLKYLCPQDVAGKIRDIAFKVPIYDFHTPFQLSTL